MSGVPPSTPFKRRGIAAVALALLAVACGGSDDPPGADISTATDADSATAADSGADSTTDSDEPGTAAAPYTIDLGNGISLTVPAGERDDVTATLASGSGDEIVVELEPDGARFETPVEIRWPAPTPETGQAVITELVLESADGTVESLPISLDTEAGAMSADITHFSKAIVRSQFDDVIQVSPTEPVLVGESAALGFRIDEDSDHPQLSSFRAVFAVLESTGWDSVRPTDRSPATDVVDVRTATIACLAHTDDDVYFVAGWVVIEERGFMVNAIGSLGCVEGTPTCPDSGCAVGCDETDGCDSDPCAETSTCDPDGCGPATADQFTVGQFHDTGALPPGFTDLGALSAIVVQPGPGVCSEAGGTALISDQNGSGTIDPGDEMLFGPQPPIDGAFWNPIDRGGPYFIVLLPGPTDVPDGLLRSPFGSVEMGAGPGELILDGAPVDVVISSSDDPRPVFYDVDFGDEVMAPQLP